MPKPEDGKGEAGLAQSRAYGRPPPSALPLIPGDAGLGPNPYEPPLPCPSTQAGVGWVIDLSLPLWRGQWPVPEGLLPGQQREWRGPAFSEARTAGQPSLGLLDPKVPKALLPFHPRAA